MEVRLWSLSLVYTLECFNFAQLISHAYPMPLLLPSEFQTTTSSNIVDQSLPPAMLLPPNDTRNGSIGSFKAGKKDNKKDGGNVTNRALWTTLIVCGVLIALAGIVVLGLFLFLRKRSRITSRKSRGRRKSSSRKELENLRIQTDMFDPTKRGIDNTLSSDQLSPFGDEDPQQTSLTQLPTTTLVTVGTAAVNDVTESESSFTIGSTSHAQNGCRGYSKRGSNQDENTSTALSSLLEAIASYRSQPPAVMSEKDYERLLDVLTPRIMTPQELKEADEIARRRRLRHEAALNRKLEKHRKNAKSILQMDQTEKTNNGIEQCDRQECQ